MDDNKICFIMCVNNWSMVEEAKHYIERLNIPTGYSIDLVTIEGAESMCAGYNEGMHSTNAKYKIYLHQDVFILNRNFLHEMLKIFCENRNVGMVGLVGAVHFPINAIQWKSYSVGKLLCQSPYSFSYSSYDNDIAQDKDIVYVESIDGLLMATQYDVEWREDLFDKWDFYDSSQSFEFRRLGYQIVVPVTDIPWLIHYDGSLNLKNYYTERRKFIEEYGKDILI